MTYDEDTTRITSLHDTIKALRAEIERLTRQCDEAHDYRVAMEKLDAQTIVELRADIARKSEQLENLFGVTFENDRLRAEVERLMALLKETRSHVLDAGAAGLVADIDRRLHADNMRLRAAIANVRQRSAKAGEILNEFDNTYRAMERKP